MRFLCCVAVVLCVAATSADDLPWWKTAIFYQVYPRSFMDSDGDGVGDLKGITQRADYFKEIGVNAIWLSPICKSPMADFGYDISNYTDIDPIFGTMQDFEDLVTKLTSINVKIVLDFVPNHSSDEHPWFQQSLDSSSDYSDFYVWRDASWMNGSTPMPPNNWISLFRGSAWKWREERQQFYFHQFMDKQPDLNYRSPNLVSNMTAVIQFWLDKGVDGFRMDAVPQIFEDSAFPNATVVSGNGSVYDDLVHIYDKNQPETFTLLQSWADVVYQQVLKDNKPRAIFLEVYDSIETEMKYYGNGTESLEFPFNFHLLYNGRPSIRPADIKTLVDQYMEAIKIKGGVGNWVVGNHDNARVADRYGYEMVDTINLLTGVLPGIKVVYYGEEFGMQDTFIRWDQTVDTSGLLAGESGYQSSSRDPERTPMQWNNSLSAGFSTNSSTWLPVNPNYWWLNVEAQKSADNSHLKVFQALAQARKDPVLMYGDYNITVHATDTLVLVRSYNASYFVLLVNMGSEVLNYDSSGLFPPLNLDVDMTVVTASVNSDYTPGTNFQKGSLSLTLRPKAAILLKSGTSSSSSSSSGTGTRVLGSFTVLLCTLLVFVWT